MRIETSAVCSFYDKNETYFILLECGRSSMGESILIFLYPYTYNQNRRQDANDIKCLSMS